MFRGANTLSLDSKGRLSIPTRYRELLLSESEGKMVCTVDLHQPCLLLYPLVEWEEIEFKLRQLSSMNAQERRVQRVLLGNAHEVDMDKAGRILLPAQLRQHAELQKSIVLTGQLNKFEMWSEEQWHAQMAEDIAAELEGDYEMTDRLKEFSF
ncbi:division/cell wall cluster transcriptional repressor MraZ [Psychrosphaera haliotis]|uniref:Transcriptional regulator MraZ n=1 Tax=Psychrosphaera haliotis TaxID=555083 RepID=A0A6N8F8E0_9GAMM|nr:division/cell wall cluster transcriptional repressor MraZ [Psychrosphaera haliotis]MDA8621823.1 division/cell wall cluster transcriptional repressor MraZ [Psychrosphaera sp.]MDB2372929.1 division/cell wall cluster transcriptional repressor MraZ [Psychrosphaera haliotis]MUH72518.1 division/cell wall cluster transcriptional repressor MraZ [Psychrosphaera haliotis]